MLVAFLFVAIIVRIAYIEVFDSDMLRARAIDQWTRDIPLTAERGDILDRNGVILADSNTSYTVYVRPNSVKDKVATTDVLVKVLGVDREKLYTKITSKVSEITVAKQITKQTMLDIINSGVTGTYFSQNIKRFYPYGNFLTQVLGFTNIDAMGQSGVEAYYNKYLAGVNGYILTETDLVGREREGNPTTYVPGKRGNDAYLTIDYYIQSFAENAVSTAYEKYNAKSTTCVVMNPKTGEIMAMAQNPSYDLNNVPRDNIAKLFGDSKSIAVSNVYEPGSTFKIITSAIGLNTGSINRNYSFFCPGYRIIDGKRIKCWRSIGHGTQTFDEGVQNSCNCLFMDTALKVGANMFYQNIDAFGLTTKTGIDMSGEASGLVIPLKSVKNVDLARIGFGQAIAMTPIELLTAASAVVNGGNMVTPYVVDKIVSKEGNTMLRNYPNNQKRVITADTSAQMREILEKVVSLGSGKKAKVDGYAIGGKTGTAQKYENGIIAQGKYVSTFLGFAPANDPEYIILMIVDEPKGNAYYGSIVAAPYVGDIFKNIFNYKNILPSFSTEKETFIMSNLVGMETGEANQWLKKNKLYFEVIGEGNKIISQIPAYGSYANSDTVVLIELGV